MAGRRPAGASPTPTPPADAATLDKLPVAALEALRELVDTALADARRPHLELVHAAAAADAGGLAPFNRVKDVAAYLTVSPDTIYRLVESRGLGCVRVGTGRGGIRIRRTDVAAYVAANARALKGGGMDR